MVTGAREDADGVPLVSLAVFNPGGMFFNQDVGNDESNYGGGTWHWPERIEESTDAG